MRKKLLRGFLVVALATGTIGTVDAGRPARAADTAPCEYVEECPPPGPTVLLGLNVVTFLRQVLTEAAIDRLVNEIIDNIIGFRTEVLTDLDSVLASRARFEVDRFTREFMNYNVIRQSVDGLWDLARELDAATADVTADAYALTDRRAVDQIGHAVNTLHFMTSVVGKDAGWTQAALDDLNRQHIEVNEMLVRKLEPTCTFRDQPMAPDFPITVLRTHTCTAADGNTASADEWVVQGQVHGEAVNINQLKLDAAINSSWVVALQMLPLLRNP